MYVYVWVCSGACVCVRFVTPSTPCVVGYSHNLCMCTTTLHTQHTPWLPRTGDHVYMVVNGATKHGDMQHFKEQMEAFGGDVSMEYMEDQALVAVQGDGAKDVVQKLVPSDVDLSKVPVYGEV